MEEGPFQRAKIIGNQQNDRRYEKHIGNSSKGVDRYSHIGANFDADEDAQCDQNMGEIVQVVVSESMYKRGKEDKQSHCCHNFANIAASHIAKQNRYQGDDIDNIDGS